MINDKSVELETKVHPRKIMMGVGDGVASVIMLTFTSEPCPHADFYKWARPPCWHSLGCDWLAGLAKAVVGLF